ncbi:coagulation factor VIII-like isoform X2 [Hyperolius riggenbachi]|uniref:coagulation factor VIII-like isoform X2 n=1 Tax=Hyperolius riggenbachi TaxID=752182 RepID=UPI0035A3CF04
MELLFFLQLLAFFHTNYASTRIFYIAAEEQYWNYRENNVLNVEQRESGTSLHNQIYKKAIYMEYTDISFTKPKPKELWAGIMGPILRLETFDSAIIHFKNLASIPYSFHGIGVSYRKSSEGAGYDDRTIKQEKADDAIPPGQVYTYSWDIPESYGPADSDSQCITSAYYSHSNTTYDINTGLFGVLLICKPGTLSESGYQHGVQEKIMSIAVFDESHSHYKNELGKGEVLHTVNGYINGSIPEQVICQKKIAYFHVIGFGTHTEVHSVSLEGHSFLLRENRVPILPISAFSFLTAVIYPEERGIYKLSCQTGDHPEGKMTSLIKVEECAAEHEVRSALYEEEEEDDDYESIIYDIPHIDVRAHSKHKPVTWTHYIAAIEVEWDYQLTGDKKSRFNKVMYREFTNSKFTHQKPSEIPGTGILGPVIRGEVGDQIQIVFKNLARYPFNMFPQGLSSVSSAHTSLKGEQLKNYPIYTNESITYIWQVTIYDSPASSDPRCLTRFYASFLNLQRDVASGLIGPLLVCSKQTLDQRGNQVVTDKEHILFFFVLDETLSWFHEEAKRSHRSVSGNQTNHKTSEWSLMHRTWHVTPKSPLAEFGMKATLRVSECENNQDDDFDYDLEDSIGLRYENGLFDYPSILPQEKQPRSSLNKLIMSDYLNTLFRNDYPLMDSEITIGPEVNKVDPSAKKGKEYRAEKKIGPIHNLLESKSAENTADSVDFYDEEYSNADAEDIHLYEDQWDNDPRSTEGQLRTYFIAVEEIIWNYGAGKSPYFMEDKHHNQHGFPSYKKVVFREYLDSSFTEYATRGERDAHLGLLGPCILAEVNDEIIIQFKNMASRSYSLYSNVLSAKWKEEDSVPPQHMHTYSGKVSSLFGPTDSEEDCRTWFYTSNGHLHKDFHSGLIGPLRVCRSNVLKRSSVNQILMEDFSLAFMKMDETKSWYFEENWQKHCTPTCLFQKDVLSNCSSACLSIRPPEDEDHEHIFYAFNGYSGNYLPGLLVPLERKVRWHLLSIGRRDILSVHFHGNILRQGSQKGHPFSIVNLYPGVGVTLEMTALITGLWLIESEGKCNIDNMKVNYIVYDPRCHQPLGLVSGKIKDSQITASGHYGSWLPYLARLKKGGSINAWSTDNTNSWIQVDLLEPVLIHKIQTQGAKQRLLPLYISQYVVFYSLNGEQWNEYQGNTSNNQMVFFGNIDSSTIQENHFNPPIFARFIRIHPIHTGARAGLRMELFGCDITSCSMSVGMESGVITPQQLSASSFLYSVFSSWVPNLARLHQQGRINAWRPKADTPNEWFQIDLGRDMKVTGLMTQGARSFTSMFITQFSLSFSSNGLQWSILQSLNGERKIFQANKDSDTPMWVTLETPVITRFLKLHPEKWNGGIALRIEVLGCNI